MAVGMDARGDEEKDEGVPVAEDVPERKAMVRIRTARKERGLLGPAGRLKDQHRTVRHRGPTGLRSMPFQHAPDACRNVPNRPEVKAPQFLRSESLRIDPHLPVQHHLVRLLGAPLVGDEELLPHEAGKERLGRVHHLQDPAVLGASGAFVAPACDQDVAARLHGGRGAGDPLDGLVQVAVQRRAGVRRDDEVERRVQRLHAVTREEAAPRQVGLHRVAGKDPGDALARVQGDVDEEIGSGHGEDLETRLVEGIALQLAVFASGVGHHPGPVHVLERLDRGDAREDRLSSARVPGPHVGLDEPREDLEIRVHVAPVHERRHRSADPAHLHHLFPSLGEVVDHPVRPGDLRRHQTIDLLVRRRPMDARGDQDQDLLARNAGGIQDGKDRGKEDGVRNRTRYVAHDDAGALLPAGQRRQGNAADRIRQASFDGAPGIVQRDRVPWARKPPGIPESPEGGPEVRSFRT